MFDFDNQLLRDLAVCEAGYITRHVHRLRGKGANIAADVGNAYHAALQAHFGGKGKRDVVALFEQRYNEVVPPGEQPKEERFGRQNCIKIMERFVDTRPVEKFPFVPIELEQVRGIRLDEEFTFWFKRDMLAQMKGTGQIVPVDHKTTGRLTEWWARKYRKSSQINGYCWATGQEYGQAITGAYVNGIEVAKLPDSMKRCEKHGVKFAECGPEHANFQLYQYTRTPEQLDKWKQDALVMARKARFLATAFADLRALPYALKSGEFNEECVWCEFEEFCRIGFDLARMNEYIIIDRWEPWKEGTLVGGRK